MVDGRRGWRLERSDCLVVLATGRGLTAYGESGAAVARAHRCPAWKLAVPLDGAEIAVGERRRRDPVLLPPMDHQEIRSDGPFVTLFADVWCWPADLASRASPSGAELHAWARSFLDGRAGTAQAARVVQPTWGEGRPRGRLGAAVDSLRGDGVQVGEVARLLGLSPSRTRAVVRRELGCTLTDVRRWLALVRAYADMGTRGPADAAASAGFADQPHLTRSSRTLVGRTPGSVLGTAPRLDDGPDWVDRRGGRSAESATRGGGRTPRRDP